MPRFAVLIPLMFLAVPGVSHAAGEGDFLKGLQGAYSGQGTVRLRTNSSTIKVNCTFNATSSATTLSLNGRCRGLVLVSRSVDHVIYAGPALTYALTASDSTALKIFAQNSTGAIHAEGSDVSLVWQPAHTIPMEDAA